VLAIPSNKPDQGQAAAARARLIVIPAKAGISGEGAGQESHEIPASAGMTAYIPIRSATL